MMPLFYADIFIAQEVSLKGKTSSCNADSIIARYSNFFLIFWHQNNFLRRIIIFNRRNIIHYNYAFHLKNNLRQNKSLIS